MYVKFASVFVEHFASGNMSLNCDFCGTLDLLYFKRRFESAPETELIDKALWIFLSNV